MNFFVIMCRNVLNVWSKTTLLLVWPKGAKRLDTSIPPNLGGGKISYLLSATCVLDISPSSFFTSHNYSYYLVS